MSTTSQHPYRQVSGSSSSAPPYPVSDFNVTNSQSDRSDSSPSMTEVTSGLEDMHMTSTYNKGSNHSQSQSQQQQQQQQEQQYQQQQQPYRSLLAVNQPPPSQQQQQRNASAGAFSQYSGSNVNFPPHLVPNLPQTQQAPQVPTSDHYIPQQQSAQISPVRTQTFEQTAPFNQSPKIGATVNVKSPTMPYPMYETSSTPPPVFGNSKDSIVVSPPSNPLSTASSVTNLNLNTNNTTASNQNNLSLDNQMFSRSENNLSMPSPMGKFGHSRSVSSTSSFFYERNDNASMVDFNQNVIQQYLGSNSQHLMPRIKTLELYRKNAKKSNDANVLFQYAQYMLQTALLLGQDINNSANANAAGNTNTTLSSQSSGENTPSYNNSPRKGPMDAKDRDSKAHKKNKSIDFSNIELEGNEKKLKKSLLKEAVFYLKKLSDKGYVEAQYLLGDAYSSGALEKIDNREAFILFQSAAKHGHVESAYRTSYCYEEGLGTGRDARKAVEYLKIAAAKNHPAAMYKLGVYSFYSRMGLPNDMNTKKMGIKWLTRATNVATELTAAAPFELGKLYYNGFEDIIITDRKYALELYAQAAALGHTQSAAILGSHYEYGDDIIPQDSNLSIHYYTQAALGGDAHSMLSMCAWYLVGADPFLPKDEAEAFEWAKRAASCNLPKAQFALANFFEKGIGCVKNVAEAQMWYRKAAENGDEKSLARLTDRELAKNIQKKLKKSGKFASANNYGPPSFNGVGASSNGQSTRAGTGDAGAAGAQKKRDCVIM